MDTVFGATVAAGILLMVSGVTASENLDTDVSDSLKKNIWDDQCIEITIYVLLRPCSNCMIGVAVFFYDAS